MNKKVLIIASIAIIGGGALVYSQFNNAEAKNKQEQKEAEKMVKTIDIKGGASEDNMITRQGIIKGQTEVYLSAKAEGRVQKLYKEIGERVYKGQLLAYVDGREYWAQSNVAKTGVDFSDKVVSKTKKFFDEQVHQAEKGKDLAKDAYKSAKESGDAEAIGKSKANYEMAKKSVEVAKDGYKLQVEVAKGQRDVAQSQLNAANTVAGNTNLRAPFAGVIAQVKVEVGDLVGPQRPILLLVDDRVKEIEVSVEGYYLKGVEVGEEITVVAKNGEKIKAKVKAVSPMIDTHTRKGIIKVELPKNEALELGEYADVLIPQSKTTTTNEVIIPQEAIVRVYHDTFVFTVEDGKAKKKKVELGEFISNGVIVKDGLNGDEKIIIEGQQYLREGESVNDKL
jgi:RND family efflux transporter MFP subunit